MRLSIIFDVPTIAYNKLIFSHQYFWDVIKSLNKKHDKICFMTNLMWLKKNFKFIRKTYLVEITIKIET